LNKTINAGVAPGRMPRHATDKKLEISYILTALFFPFTIIYYEIIFKIAVGNPLFCMGSFVMIMYAAFVGGVVYALSTLCKKTAVNIIVGSVLTGLIAVPYLVEYFIYRAFKIFYDINTLTGGAQDAMTGFASDIIKLVFSPLGLLMLFLYFLPVAVLACCGKLAGFSKRPSSDRRMRNLCFAAVCYLLMVLLVSFVPRLRNMQGSEYSFQTAMENMGLLRSMRLDLVMGGNVGSSEFEGSMDINNLDIKPVNTDGKVPDDGGGAQTDPNEPEVFDHITDKMPKKDDYGFNSLDIDYANLTGGNETHKKLNAYVAGLTPSKKNPYTGVFQGKNLIMISAEAFSAEVIDPELTPTLYRMATKGINFTDYYQPASAGTTGGEYQNIFGYLPMSGGKSLKNMANRFNWYTMGSQLDRLGYYGKAFHNHDYAYYDRHKTHVNLGYSDGYMGYGNGMEEFVQKKWPESDLEMLQGTLPMYIDKQPFNIYYMSVSGHGTYSKTGNAMSKKNWSRVEHLEGSEAVKGYIAANLELEDAMTYLITELENAGIADNTVICISADHFPYGLEDNELAELYGYTPDSNLQRDHSRLILWCGELEKYDPIIVSSPTFSLDILPTLSNLFGTEFDSRLMPGRDVFSDAPALVFNTGYEWKTDYGTYTKGTFVPTYEDVELPEDYVKSIKSIVSNKINYCRNAPDSDYFKYLFK